MILFCVATSTKLVHDPMVATTSSRWYGAIELLNMTPRIRWQLAVSCNGSLCSCGGPFYKIPRIIINRREETRMLSEKRRNGSVAAISERNVFYCKSLVHDSIDSRRHLSVMPIQLLSTMFTKSTWTPFSHAAKNAIACIYVQYRSNATGLSKAVSE